MFLNIRLLLLIIPENGMNMMNNLDILKVNLIL